jgi:hypothetical protein
MADVREFLLVVLQMCMQVALKYPNIAITKLSNAKIPISDII